MTLASLFIDDNAAGSAKFGKWRENPTWKLTVSKKTTVYIAINEDGALDDASKATLEKKKAKKAAAYEKARDRMVATQAAAQADEKNEELAAAAKDAARVFEELDAAKRLKEQRVADGEEDLFGALGLHVVRNSRESWIPGVLSGYSKLAGTDPYGDDQARRPNPNLSCDAPGLNPKWCVLTRVCPL